MDVLQDLIFKSLSTIFSDELNFFTRFLIGLCFISFTVEIFYFIAPQFIRVRLEKIDLPEGGSISMTASLAIFSLLCMMLTKLQRMSITPTEEQKLHESAPEKAFRHKN